MPDAPLPNRFVHLACEFFVTVALASICLLAILHTVQYHVRLFLGAGSPCERVALELAAVSPLAILKITAVCAALVLLALEACAHTGRFTARSRRMPDPEGCTAETYPDAKSDAKPRSDLVS